MSFYDDVCETCKSSYLLPYRECKCHEGNEAKHVLDMFRDAAKIHAALYKAAYEYSMVSSNNRLRRDFSGVTFGDYTHENS